MPASYNLKMPHAVYGGENAMDNITAITEEVEKKLQAEPTAKDWDDFWHNL